MDVEAPALDARTMEAADHGAPDATPGGANEDSDVEFAYKDVYRHLTPSRGVDDSMEHEAGPGPGRQGQLGLADGTF